MKSVRGHTLVPLYLPISVLKKESKENGLEEETVSSRKTWQHSGFRVLASDPISFEDKVRLLRYAYGN